MAVPEQDGGSYAEFWTKIPLEVQFEIDTAIGRGEKPLAVNHLVCAKVGFNIATAVKFIEQRKKEMPKSIPNKKI
jgi:hypothetical protein